MSKRDVQLFLNGMLEAIEKIERFTAGLNFDEFELDDMAVDAVVRNLEIVGEAAKFIPPELRDKYPLIEWSRVVVFVTLSFMPILMWIYRLCGLSLRSVFRN